MLGDGTRGGSDVVVVFVEPLWDPERKTIYEYK
jgi:hypothetical protein